MEDIKDLPIVSICCCTYNHASYIRQCLDGFMMQETNFPFEVLIHDDASTDGTADIVREYEAQYPNIIKPIYQVENQYSKGVRGIARKYNYSRVQGRYMAICEGDDYWTDPYKLQRQVDFLRKNEDVILSAENGLVKNFILNTEYFFNKETNEKYYSAYEMLQIRRFPTASVVFKVKYMEDILKLKFTADTILWVLLSTKGKVHYNPVVSSVYNRGIHGVVEGTNRMKWIETTRNWDNQIIEIIKNSSLKDDFDYSIFKKRSFREFFDAYSRYSYKNNAKEKKQCLSECFKISPIRTLRMLIRANTMKIIDKIRKI